jgi:hypothetical protein
VTPADVGAIIESKSEWAGSTKALRLNALSSSCMWAVKQGLADRNPVADVERPPREDTEWPMIPTEGFCRMRLHARDVLEDALLLTLATTSARHNELLSIDHADLIPDLPGLTIRKGNGRNTREVPRLPQPAEQQQPQYGAVPVGVGDGGRPLGSREEALAFLNGQPSGQGAPAARDGDAEEGVTLRVPVVPQVAPERAQRGEAARDAVGLVPFGAKPGDVLTHDLAVNVLRSERPGTNKPAEQPEVGGVGGDGRGTAVAVDFQI